MCTMYILTITHAVENEQGACVSSILRVQRPTKYANKNEGLVSLSDLESRWTNQADHDEYV